MAELHGTRTERNLLQAFAGESQARNRYDFFASRAKKEGYEQIAALFEETARNEKEHAKIWLKLLCGGEIPPTLDNLRDSADDELGEWSGMYKRMAEEARSEGFDEIARLFDLVGDIEKHHEDRFRILRSNIRSGAVFKREGEDFWVCRNCGHVEKGEAAPETCPFCSHPRAYFELVSVNY